MLRRASRKKRRFWSSRPLPNADRCNGLETKASARTDTQSSTSAGEYFLNKSFICTKILAKVYYELFLGETSLLRIDCPLIRTSRQTCSLLCSKIIGRDLTLLCGCRKYRRKSALEGAHRED